MLFVFRFVFGGLLGLWVRLMLLIVAVLVTALITGPAYLHALIDGEGEAFRRGYMRGFHWGRGQLEEGGDHVHRSGVDSVRCGCAGSSAVGQAGGEA